jgi:activating signal cointegrator 1
MKAITLTQPWATLIAIGAKRIETRSWNTSHRGLIAIHAGSTFPRHCAKLTGIDPYKFALRSAGIGGAGTLPTACILAVATLERTMLFDHTTEAGLSATEAAFGDFTSGRYGFVLRDVRRLAEPVGCTGALSIWTVKPEIEAQIWRQLPK